MAEKKTEERPEQIRIQSAIEMTPWERGTALGLLAFGAAPMVMAWIRLFTQPFELKAWVDLSILGLFTFISNRDDFVDIAQGLPPNRSFRFDDALAWRCSTCRSWADGVVSDPTYF